MSKELYCPVCGHLHRERVSVCYHCHAKVQSEEAKYDTDRYRNMASNIFGDRTMWYKCLLQEIEQNPMYDKHIGEMVTQRQDIERRARLLKLVRDSQNSTVSNAPHCPTCGSTNVSKISAAKRGAHMFAFGFFSKTAVSQFECKNCGYKW